MTIQISNYNIRRIQRRSLITKMSSSNNIVTEYITKFWGFIIPEIETTSLDCLQTISTAVFAPSVPLSILNWSTFINICPRARWKQFDLNITVFISRFIIECILFCFKNFPYECLIVWRHFIFIAFNSFIVLYWYCRINDGLELPRAIHNVLLQNNKGNKLSYSFHCKCSDIGIIIVHVLYSHHVRLNCI